MSETCPFCGHREKFHYHKKAIPCCPSCPNGMCEPSPEYLATLTPKLRAELKASIDARRRRYAQG